MLVCTPLNTEENYYFNWVCLSSNEANTQIFWK